MELSFLIKQEVVDVNLRVFLTLTLDEEESEFLSLYLTVY